jgi:hypothetical protein
MCTSETVHEHKKQQLVLSSLVHIFFLFFHEFSNTTVQNTPLQKTLLYLFLLTKYDEIKDNFHLFTLLCIKSTSLVALFFLCILTAQSLNHTLCKAYFYKVFGI